MKKRQVSCFFDDFFSFSGTLKSNESIEGETESRGLRTKHYHPKLIRWLWSIMVIKLRKIHTGKFWRRSIQKIYNNIRQGTDKVDWNFIRGLARDPPSLRQHGPLVKNDSIRWRTCRSFCCKTPRAAEPKLNFGHLQRHLEHDIYFGRQIWRAPWLFRSFS